MKAKLRNSFAKRSLVIAATTLPSLYAGLAQAQTAPPPAPPAAAPVPPPPAPAAPAGALPAPIAGSSAPVAGAAEAPAVVTPAAPEMAPPPPAAPVEPPPDPMAEKYKHINMGVWMRLGAQIQNHTEPKKLNELGTNGLVEFHFSNQMRKSVAWTANIVGSFGPGVMDGSSAAGANGATPNAGSGTVAILDAIAQFEPDPAFNVWVGRMLVASDRSNFSGPWFMGPWNYPGAFGTGPHEGPSGRNNGATVWGQFAGGMFKYYLGAYNLHDPSLKPLISGRLNLALINPEPGYYSSSTYYGMDILAIGVGGQYQKNGDGGGAGPAPAPVTDYGLFNADILFEKNLQAAGVLDLEGAFFKYVGDGQALKASHFVLASYLTPDMPGIGKFQPLVRVQQAFTKDGGGGTGTSIDAQVGYVVDSYSTRFALGFNHTSSPAPGDNIPSNAIFGGVQLQK